MIAADAPLSASDVLRIFHRDEPFLFLGAAFATVGVVCAAFSVIRRRFDALLVWLGLFAFLYGQRLWFDTGLLAITLAGQELFARLRWIVDFLVPIPAFFFFQAAGMLPGRGKIFAGAIATMFLSLAVITGVAGRLQVVHDINNVIVIAALPFVLVRTYRMGRADRDQVVMRRGLLIFVLLALWDNTVGGTVLGVVIEPYGFAVFLGCLGLVAARRTLRRDLELSEIQGELEVARRIQASLLPHAFPQSASFRVAARYVPMNTVAGDFYEFLVAEGDRAGLLIADVSGHGVPAALIASMVKMAALSMREHAAHPGRLLTGMNRALCGSTQGQYVTAAYAHLDAGSGELRYSAAGHPPLLRLRRGEVTEIAENGMLLAAVEEVEYTDRTIALEPGDRFLFYTDGLVEARNAAGVMFGDDALKARFEQTATLSPAEAATEIVEAVKQWRKAPEDDLTVLLCEYSGGVSAAA
jgi:sigma-B regulation protein RsbU (phosphoserine phosphatase)